MHSKKRVINKLLDILGSTNNSVPLVIDYFQM